ncbi:ParD-like family protein [Pseudomonas sp. CBSPCAW29]|nr:ParD-like family protein [Pseudomonas sp. CBSPCAW29]
MGIVKITDQLHEQLRLASATMDRSINAQAEFWIKIGLLAELNPHLAYNDLINKLLLDKPDLIRGARNDQDGGTTRGDARIRPPVGPGVYHA